MKLQSVLDKQLNFLLTDLITTKQKNAETITLADVFKNVLTNAINLSSGEPLFSGDHIERYKKVDINVFNKNIKYLNQDVYILQTTLDDIINYSNNFMTYTSDKALFLQSNITKIERSIDMIKAYNTNEAYTYIETFKSSDNLNSAMCSNIKIDEDLQMVSIQGNDKTRPLKSTDVTIAINEANKIPVRLEVTSNKQSTHINDLIGFERGKSYNLNLRTTSRVPITCVITITVNKPEYRGNIITVYPNMDRLTAGNVMVYMDDVTVPVVSEARLFEQTPIRIQAPLTGILNKVVITLYRTEENSFSNDSYYNYLFSFNGVTVENKSYSNVGTIISNGIQKTFNEETVSFNKISMVSSAYIPDNSSINYYVSKDGLNWHSIIPYNVRKDPRNIINFSNNISYQIDNIKPSETQWGTISKITSYGSVPLYNILEIMPGNSIVIPEPESLLPDTVELERGIGDYSIEYNEGKIYGEVKNAPIVFTAVNKRASISIPVTEVCSITSSPDTDTYKVNTTYPIIYTDAFLPKVVINKNGKTYECDVQIITNSTDEIHIEDSDENPFVGIPTDLVTVTYYTSLKDYSSTNNIVVELDKFFFEVYRNNTETGTPIDSDYYDFNVNDLKMKINRFIDANTIGSTATILYTSYKYITRKKQNYRIFNTYVTVDTPTKIQIFPFLDTEIISGNFHKIDGYDCSKQTSFNLTIGRHHIQTTQPFKSGPSALDKNDLTDKKSTAGIDLSNIDQTNIMAYEFPMKKVSVHQLTNIVAPLDHRSFAVDENGKVLINYLPEEIHNFDMNNPYTGVNLLCKKAVYNSNGDFDRYEFISETFRLKYQTRSDEQSYTTFYYKVVINRDEKSNYTPEINRLSFNLI